MTEEYRKIVNEFLGLPEDEELEFKNVSDMIVVGTILCKRLDRIADALEGINQECGSISNSLHDLSDCVETVPRTGETRLHITGMVETFGN